MRASPPFQVSVTRFGTWRAGVVALTLAAGVALGAWMASRDDLGHLFWAWGVAAAALVLLASAIRLARTAPVTLRWDSHERHLGPPGPAGESESAGHLAVAIDLGAWLLLRFRHATPAGRHCRFVWLPVQRRGLEAQWHGLRCAVYCSRPVSGNDAGTRRAVDKDSKNERP
jgi:hypothetical protein